MLKEYKKKLTQGFLELGLLLVVICSFFLFGFLCTLLIPVLGLDKIYTTSLQGITLLGFLGTGIYFVKTVISSSQEVPEEER